MVLRILYAFCRQALQQYLLSLRFILKRRLQTLQVRRLRRFTLRSFYSD